MIDCDSFYIDSTEVYLRFLDMDAIYDVNEVFVPVADDGTTGPISISPGFPFGSSVQTQFYVSSEIPVECVNVTISFDCRWEQMAFSHLDLATTHSAMPNFPSQDAI